MHRSLHDGFTLALGGGGARGWAHIGVARALESLDLRPARIVGTSMGAIIGAGLAAGRSADEMEADALRTPVLERMTRPARLAWYDARALIRGVVAELGNPRIEELPTPLGITTFDLVTGRASLITTGPLDEALVRSIAVPFMLPPRCEGDAVWCDAGPWEGVPVSHARAWDPEHPVVGVLADVTKPGVLSSRVGARLLRTAAHRLHREGSTTGRLTARRYLALVLERYADPVVDEAPDLLIRPRLGMMSALSFSHVQPAIDIGERDAREALRSYLAIGAAEASVHAA
ncbi:MAG TPA: patatin-like phospholipase family protein [Candidatus Limnocylindria bacterium]|nr:patatin-like phospholipase family protein [Candidatus Limnocylindria bacterium]